MCIRDSLLPLGQLPVGGVGLCPGGQHLGPVKIVKLRLAPHIEAVAPVSYTHLDVYKRQPHMRVLPDKFLDLLHGCSSVIDSEEHDNIIPDKREEGK